MTGWACAACGGPVDGASFDMWCPTCRADVVAVETRQNNPGDPVRRGQYRAICALLTSLGIVNRAQRMRRLSTITGRPIGDYWELTATEADVVKAALKEEHAHA